MKVLIKSEEAAIFLFCLFLFTRLNLAWWWLPALLLGPDIAMIGYAVNTKTGAWIYNLFHHRLTAAAVASYALVSGNEYWKLAAIILFAHIAMDRFFGFGLKYADSFKHTHLSENDVAA